MRARGVDLVQEQIDALSERVRVARLEERIDALARLTDERFDAFGELMKSRFVTLRTVVDGQAEKVALALTASQTAIDKADAADEKARDRLAEDVRARFNSVNEFRAQQKDIISTFMPRTEFDAFRERHVAELSELKERIDKSEGRSGGVAGVWGVIVAVVGIAVAIGALLFRNM